LELFDCLTGYQHQHFKQMRLPDLPEKLMLSVLRVLTGIIFTSHAAARLIYWTIPGFGEFLNSKGFGIGLPLAWLTTVAELLCGTCLIIGYKVRYCVIFHATILISGIFLVHLPNGWFTVGQSSGGVEYSLLLLAVLGLLYSKYKK
jgi:putative oxidoreductase